MLIVTAALTHVYSRIIIENKEVNKDTDTLLKMMIAVNRSSDEAIDMILMEAIYKRGERRYIDIEKVSDYLVERGVRIDVSNIDLRDMFYDVRQVDDMSLAKMTSALVLTWLSNAKVKNMNSLDTFADIKHRTEDLLSAIIL